MKRIFAVALLLVSLASVALAEGSGQWPIPTAMPVPPLSSC